MSDVLKGDLYYLNNDYYAKVEIDGNVFDSATAAYYSFKLEPHRRKEFCGLLPSEAKERAEEIEDSEDWKERKDHYLYLAVLNKFMQNKWLGDKMFKVKDIGSLDEGVMFDVLRLVQMALFVEAHKKANDILLEHEKTFKIIK